VPSFHIDNTKWVNKTEQLDILAELDRHYSIVFDRLDFLRDGGCTSYIAYSHANKYLLKVVSSAFMDTAKQSIDILLYLQRCHFPAPRLVLTVTDMPYFEAATSTGWRTFVLFEFIEGREPILGERVEQIGELVGWLHDIMEGYGGKLTVRNKHFFIDRYMDILRLKHYPERKLAGFIEYGDELWERIKNLPRGYCHGDLHRGNLLYAPSGELYLLDFDTSCNAFPAYDIMVMCDATDYFRFESNGYARSRNVYERFLNGYFRHQTLSNAELVAFDDLIAVRHYQLQATIIEINGLDCVDEGFLDEQLDWLMKWKNQCEKERA